MCSIYTSINGEVGARLTCVESQTSKYKKGSDWLKRWMEAQLNIKVEKCLVIGQY